MKLSRKQIAEIEGKIYLLSRTPRDQWSTKLSEIIGDIKKMIADFERGRKHHFASVKRCLVVLLKLLESGHVSIISVEDREVFNWVLKEARRIVDTWED